MVGWKAIYILWLREMKRFARAPSRVAGAVAMPLLFLAFLATGFSKVSFVPGVDYSTFIVPGIIGMSLLLSSTMAGMSVLWDRQFGFLKEIMVAPVRRVFIALGRIAGGATIALLQGLGILLVSVLFGFKLTGLLGVAEAVALMLLVSMSFISVGLIIASLMRDIQGFGFIVNFLVFPLFFLSGAVFPLSNLPSFVQPICFADPLTYGVDGLRAALVGSSVFPLWLDAGVLACVAGALVLLAAFFFEKSPSV
ncbi:ABC transporter permease [Candidatus Micrarchaeota archaeon]|nr:ABC transporter permease [Candidatus Micrarchaeota archaeon]